MQSFYLGCFWVGLLLSAFSLFGVLGHFGGHVHVPHAGHVHLPHGAAAHAGTDNTATAPWWNVFSLMVFLCWFGAAGYLLTRHGGVVTGLVFLLAALCGFAGGALVFVFLNKVLLPHERELTADETAVIGAVGRVSAAIHRGGTGEMVYQQMGALVSVPARADAGCAIGRDEEVFVVRYERGIAYVRRWEELETVRAKN